MDNRYNNIIHNKKFTELLERLAILEADRIFCRHGMEHLLDVSRIAYIYVLENNVDISKDLVYAAGLLHDIGRVAEYEGRTEHHEKGAEIAADIMSECGYDSDEIRIVSDAILSHRITNEAEDVSLKTILYNADKESRNCFLCNAYDLCKWDKNRKNKGVK